MFEKHSSPEVQEDTCLTKTFVVINQDTFLGFEELPKVAFTVVFKFVKQKLGSDNILLHY